MSHKHKSHNKGEEPVPLPLYIFFAAVVGIILFIL